MSETLTLFVPAHVRSIALPGVPADDIYTMSVEAYRKVDADIAPNGQVLSYETIASPYRPTTMPAFEGDIVGTIQGRDSLQVVLNLEAIVSDNVLSTTEKQGVILAYNQLTSTHDAVDTKATALGGYATEQAAASAAVTALTTYLDSLTPLWSDTEQHTPIDPTVFQNHWTDAYTALADLQAAVTGAKGDPGTPGAPGAPGSSGSNSAAIFLYKRSATAPALPSVATTYTFATGILATANNGWTQSVPADNGLPLYVTTATANGTGATDTIAASEWASPVVMAQSGSAGANGLQAATVYLYKRSASPPAVPSVTSTFTFSTGTLSGHNNGWTQAVPASDGNPLYVTTASALATAPSTTDTIATGEWSSPSIMAQDGAPGAAGSSGASSAIVFLYKRSASLPTLPSVSTTYTFATGSLSGANNGWTQSVPASDGNPLYITAAAASGTGSTDTIAAGEWASPVIMVQDGSDGDPGSPGSPGANGINAATVFLYKRSASAPSLPSATTTYTFATGALSGITNGWTQSVPANDGNPLYVTTATALGTGSTDTIASSEWATAQIMAQNGANGANGSNGLNNATVFLYQRSASPPSAPSATTTYTFATGVLSGTLGSWSQNIPSGTNPLYVTVATASGAGTTDTIASGEWASPVVMAQDGSTGSPGSPGTPGSNGVQAASVFLYKRSATVPTLPSVTATYTFATGVLTGQNNGWTQTIPASDGNPCYVTTATALATAPTATDTIGTGEWASPSILVQDGSTGAPGSNNATVHLYKRSATAPTLPSVSTTYTFATGVLTAANNGWTQAVPAANGNPLYVTIATASSSNPTDTIAAAEWATPVIMASDGSDGSPGSPGSTGSNGLQAASVFLYKRSASAPAVPSVTSTYTFSTGVLSGQNNGWTQTIPAADGNPCYVTTASALATAPATTDTIATGEWATPTILVQDGTSPYQVTLTTYSITVTADDAGVTKSGQLPKTSTLSVAKGAAAVAYANISVVLTPTAGITASYNSTTGIISITQANAEGYVSVAVSVSGTLVATPRIQVTRLLDAGPPQSQTTASLSSLFGTNSTSYVAGSDVTTILMRSNASGQLQAILAGSYDVDPGAGSTNLSSVGAVKGVYRLAGSGGAYSDFGTEVTGTAAAYDKVTAESTPGSFSLSQTKTGLTANTQYEVGFSFRRSSGSAVTISGSVNYTVKQP